MSQILVFPWRPAASIVLFLMNLVLLFLNLSKYIFPPSLHFMTITDKLSYFYNAFFENRNFKPLKLVNLTERLRCLECDWPTLKIFFLSLCLEFWTYPIKNTTRKEICDSRGCWISALKQNCIKNNSDINSASEKIPAWKILQLFPDIVHLFHGDAILENYTKIT